MKSVNITKGSIPKAMFAYFIPVWIGTFFQYFYNTADALIVGNFLGKDALAAVGGPAAMMVNLFVGFFVGLGSGASVLVSQFFGARDVKNTHLAVHTAMALGIISGVIMSVLGISLSPVLLKLTGTPPELIDMCLQYITIYFAGIVFMVIYNLGSSILRAIGDSRRPLIFLIIASIINIVLDIVFIVIIPLGVAGVALATVISQSVSAVCVVIVLSRSNECYKLYIKRIRPHLDILKGMLRIGVPAGLQVSVYTISNLLIQSKINSFGTDTIAAWSAYAKIDGIIWMTLSAVGITMTTFSGQNFGARDVLRIKKSVKISLGFSFAVCAVMGAIMLAFSSTFLSLFVSDANVIAIGATMMLCIIPFYILWAPVEVFGSVLRGAGDTLIPTIVQLFGVCILRIVWMYVVLPMNNSIELLCFGYPISWFATSFVIIAYYLKGNWVQNGLKRLDKIVK